MWNGWQHGRKLQFTGRTKIVIIAFNALLASALIVSAGCATAKLARRAHRARVDLTGLSRAELEKCAGLPMRVEQTGAWQYLMYASPLRADQERSTQCVATFMVRNGYVEDLNYESPTGGLMGNDVGECLAIVDRCLPVEKK